MSNALRFPTPTALKPKNILIAVAATLVISRLSGFLATVEVMLALSQVGFLTSSMVGSDFLMFF